MFSPRVKNGVFLLEGLNSLATTFYFYYLYFFMQRTFGFDRMQNLLLAAGLGIIYIPGSLIGGRFGQRHGYFLGLKIGFAGLAVVLLLGSRITGLYGHLAVAVIGTIAMCFTWPTLEAIVSEHETPERLQKLIGIYNLVWAGLGAIAYFLGGAMIETFGVASMFLVPAAIHILQLVLTFWLEKRPSPAMGLAPRPSARSRSEVAGVAANAETFLRMAWVANPFAYLAINTVVAVIPNIATKLGLSATYAGFFCSVWLFVRTASFGFLWKWTGWHYRFGWLLAAFLGVLLSFVCILLAPNLAVLIGSQVAFGLALGLIYYSSLYYSMDVGDTKGDHGGIHEAAIGAGNFAGPALGAAALYFFPQHVNSSTWAVSGFLVCGLAGLLWMRWRKG